MSFSRDFFHTLNTFSHTPNKLKEKSKILIHQTLFDAIHKTLFILFIKSGSIKVQNMKAEVYYFVS